MSLSRTRSNGPGHMVLDEATSGNISGDGRFKIRFHDDVRTLTRWCHGLQSSFKKPQSRASSSASSTIDLEKGKQSKTTDLPSLNIAIHIVGSRGDVQPFIPIAQLLSKPPFNHRVRICTHPVFKDFIEAQGVEFFSIGGDPEALMAYMVKNPGLLPNRESVKAGDVGKRREEMWQIMNGAWRSCIEAGNGMGERVKAANVRNPKDLFLADVIIANPPSMAHIHCAEKLGIPLHMVFTMPWSPTETFSHPLAAMNYGNADAKTANYLSFVMMEMLTWQGLGDLISKFRHQILHLDTISPMWGFQLLPRLHVPFTYLWSQSLIPKPADWGSYINIAGFSFLPLASSYTPPDDLTAFLQKGSVPIYIGFGSIVVDDPDALTKLIFNAVEMAGVRAIISKGWSGIGTGEDTPENIYFIGNCPHDWLFQRVSAVVHHGGAGTTAAGIAAGKPTVVVPFFGDQPFWGQMIARAGAGPVPVPFKQMTAESLAESIKFALRPDVEAGAKKMAENIAQENGAEAATQIFLDRIVREDDLQCDICPNLVAHWRHKKTGRKLSGFAVCCLIDKGIIMPSELKLLHQKSWYVDEGAEHPLVGVVASVSGFVTSVATATSDYSHTLKSKKGSVSTPSKPSSEPRPTGTNTTKEDISDPTSSQPSRQNSEHTGLLKGFMVQDAYTPAELEELARKMAKKTLNGLDPAVNLVRRPTLHDKRKAAWRSKEQGRHGRGYYVARATGRYTAELGKATLKAPVAFFWNTANGFHNFPSYGFAGVQVRRRDPITGFGSGLKAANKEFFMGIWEAFSGVVAEPYKGVRDEGAKGLGKGIWRAGKGLVFNFGAAIWGIPGYSLKGLEKELSKRHLTKLKAEIILIRVRQCAEDFRNSTPEERDEVEAKWKALG